MSGFSRTGRLLALSVATMLLSPITASALEARTAAARPDTVVTVEPKPIGRPIPRSFVGLSLEYRSVEQYAGSDPGDVNPVLVRLIENLAPGQSRVLRVGGGSADRAWWPIGGIRRPSGVRYDLTPRWIAVLRALARVTRARVILGLNLEADVPAIAAAEAGALLRGLGRSRIAAFEIGNEPELYTVFPYYRAPNGAPEYGRPPGYDVQAFLADLARFRAALPSIPLAGPATGSRSWFTALPEFLADEPGVRVVTYHRYGLNRCVTDPRSPAYPTVPHLLTPFATGVLTHGFAPEIALAHARGLSVRVDEVNSVTCGGKPGVADTFASALWMLDVLFELAGAGVDGVNIHIHPEANSNQLFTFRRVRGRWVGWVRPNYYGALMFVRAAPPGSRLLATRATGAGSVRNWAVRTPGTIRVVLINEAIGRARRVLVRPPGRRWGATLERLQAPSAYARGGVSLAGQRFGAATTTGLLQGRVREAPLKAGRSGYIVEIPAASAALVTFTPR